MAASAGVVASSIMAGQQQQSITDGQPAPANVDPTTLQNDLVAAQNAATAVSATTVSTTDGGVQIAQLESAYNAAVNKLVADLQTRDAYLTWDIGQTKASASDKSNWGTELQNNTKMINDIDAGTTMPRDGAVATGTTAGPGGIVDGSTNPGVSGNGPSPSGYGATAVASSAAAVTPTCKSGYIAPPTIPPGADMRQVVGSLTNDQAYFLGWSLSQMLKGKQVSVPPQDAQAWSTLQQWMLQNNPSLTGGGMPSDMPQSTQQQMALTGLAVNQCTGLSGEDLFQLVFGAFNAIAMGPLMGDAAEAGAIAEGAEGAATAGRASVVDETTAGSAAGAAATDAAAVTPDDVLTAGTFEASGGSATGVGPGQGLKQVPVMPSNNAAGDTNYLKTAGMEPNTLTVGKTSYNYYDFSAKPLWGSGTPKPDDFNQGAIGDCWLASTLQNIATRDPDYLKDMITPVAGQPGNYSVRLYDSTGAERDVVVDSSLPSDGSGNCVLMGAGADGIGGALIEKAIAKLADFDGNNTQTGYASLVAGSPANAVRTLMPAQTRAENYYVSTASGQRGVFDMNNKETNSSISASDFSDQMTQAIQDDTANGMTGVACIGFSSDYPQYNIVGGHMYSVVGYDTTSGKVTLFDPNVTGTDGNPRLVQVPLSEIPSMPGAVLA